jgi:flagellar hook assembly protein FlgD
VRNSTASGTIVFTHDAPGSPGSVSVSGSTGKGQVIAQLATASSVTGSAASPAGYAIGQNYPNPFNPTTTIAFTLPEASTVRLSIFNVLGQEVATLLEGEMGAGGHTAVWNASNNAGGALPSGLYFYRLHATSVAAGQVFDATRQMMLMK